MSVIFAGMLTLVIVTVVWYLTSNFSAQKHEDFKHNMRHSQEERLGNSIELNQLVDKAASFIWDLVDQAIKGKELVGEAGQYLTILMSDTLIDIHSVTKNRKAPLPTDKNYDLSCSIFYGTKSTHHGRRIYYKECGFDQVSWNEMDAMINVFERKLQAKVPTLTSRPRYVEDKKYTVLVFDMSHLHPRKTIKDFL